jgi:predicted metal-dependent phosphoesterase TrpH
MPARIDLHIHTSLSDGRTSPSKVVEIVRAKALAAFAISDHDSLEAYHDLKSFVPGNDPELITGVELSAGQGGEDIHILGYFVDLNSKRLNEAINDFKSERNRRALKMLKELNKLGIDVSMNLVREIAGKSAVGRPHIADALVRVNAVKNYESAFRKYIGHGGPAYIPKLNLTPKDAISLIHQARGLAFLAHPGIAGAVRYIDEFVRYGLDGVEVFHPLHSSDMRNRLKNIAAERSLLASGGSDYHGRRGHYGMIGSQPVPAGLLETMKNKLKERGYR